MAGFILAHHHTWRASKTKLTRGTPRGTAIDTTLAQSSGPRPSRPLCPESPSHPGSSWLPLPPDPSTVSSRKPTAHTNNPESRLSDDKDLPVGHSSVLKMLRFRLLRGNRVYSTACGSFRPGAVGDNSDHRGGCRRLGRAGRIALQGQAPPFHCANLAFRKTSSAIHD